MRPTTLLSDDQKERLKHLLSKTETKADFQRVQCIWLRAALGLPSAATAKAVGWSQSTVNHTVAGLTGFGWIVSISMNAN